MGVGVAGKRFRFEMTGLDNIIERVPLLTNGKLGGCPYRLKGYWYGFGGMWERLQGTYSSMWYVTRDYNIFVNLIIMDYLCFHN